MKHLILLSLMLFTALNSFAFHVSEEEYDQRFLSKLNGYFHQSEVSLTLTDSLPQRVTIKACQSKVRKNALTFTGFRTLLKNLTSNERQPLFKRVDRPFTDCVLLGEFKSKNSQALFKIKDLMLAEESVDLALNASHFVFESGKNSYSVDSHALLVDSILKGKNTLPVEDLATFRIKVSHARTKFYKATSVKNHTSSEPLLLIDILSRNSENAILFAGNAGVSEGYTIKEHTLRVLDLFNSQYRCSISPALEKRLTHTIGHDFYSFMRFLMSLHDLGKSRAVDEGKKYLQHDYILPVLQRNFRAVDYNLPAQLLAETLMNNDTFGDYLMNKISLQKAVEQIKEAAQITNLNVKDYFQIQKAYYTFDAGSYPYLGDIVFDEDPSDRCMTPSAQKYKNLEAKIQTL